MGIINGKWKNNDFVMNSMEQISKIFQYHVKIRTLEKVVQELA